MIIISGQQLWKLDGNTLLNKEGLWMSDEKWSFKTVNVRYKGELICIENINKTKVLGTKNRSKVILEKFEEDKHEQLWKKGEPNAQGYFTLENYKVSKVMTATSSTTLELKGNITKHNKEKLICIENFNKTKVLRAKNDSQVILEVFKRNKDGVLWRKGEPNAEGFFTLENFKGSKFMTATSSTSLQLKGNMNKVDNAL
jgi:hypothetical protein